MTLLEVLTCIFSARTFHSYVFLTLHMLCFLSMLLLCYECISFAARETDLTSVQSLQAFSLREILLSLSLEVILNKKIAHCNSGSLLPPLVSLGCYIVSCLGV